MDLTMKEETPDITKFAFLNEEEEVRAVLHLQKGNPFFLFYVNSHHLGWTSF